MKILVLSDLHLLLGRSRYQVMQDGRRVDEIVDVVTLAGDINDGVAGIRWARETFPDKPVVYVAGNHEFYDRHWRHHLDDMRDAAITHDIDFLENDAVEIAGVRFLGCSLWTDFELFGAKNQPFAMHLAKKSMNDYQCITISGTHCGSTKFLTPDLTEKRHQVSVEWLGNQLKKGGDPAKTVVVTHHAPHPKSIPPRFAEDLLSSSFASDLNRLMGKAGLWIHGHMHTSSDYTVNGTRIVCNPMGNMERNGGVENEQFDPGFVVEV